MPTLIFLRHGEKAYRNKKGPKDSPAHDPPLLPDANIKIKSKMTEIVEKYGRVDAIYSSPYLRNRETTEIIVKEVVNVPVEFYDEIGEYLGWQTPVGDPASLHPSTLEIIKSCPFLGMENLEGLKKRAISFHDKIICSDKDVLIITHGIFISKLCEGLGFEKIPHFKSFSGVVMKDGGYEYI
jgi:broad specificity phosphatase PhoE